MVAGQPIQTGALSKEFDEGFERTFGERKPGRGRYVYTQGGKPLPEPVQVEPDWSDPAIATGHKSEAEIYGNLRATDGTPIDSRTKRREYMRANNVTDASDFSNDYWSKAEKERKRAASGEADREARRETVARSFFQKFKP
jgi:hypothetical protein